MVADDDSDGDDEDDDDGETGAVALLCRIATLNVAINFVGSIGDALTLARACTTRHCVDDHVVAFRDGRGVIRTRPIGDSDPDEF